MCCLKRLPLKTPSLYHNFAFKRKSKLQSHGNPHLAFKMIRGLGTRNASMSRVAAMRIQTGASEVQPPRH